MAMAFIDFEMNCNESRKNSENNEIIQITMLIYKKLKTQELIDTFNSYVCLPEGVKLTEHSKEITGITEENLSKAPTFKECYDTIQGLIEKYNIQTIYCYGDYDEFAFRYTAKKNKIPSFRRVSRRLRDLSPNFKEKLQLKRNISLSNLSLILGIPYENKHNALSDAEQLKSCYQMLEKKNFIYNQTMLNDYKKYEILRETFNNVKRELQRLEKEGFPPLDKNKLIAKIIGLYKKLQTLEKEGLSLEKFISLYEVGKFPTFEEYLQSKF